MNILILRYTDVSLKSLMNYGERHLEEIRSVFLDADINVIDPTPEQIDAFLPNADVLIISPFNHSNLVDFSKAKNLKWVHLTAAGVGIFAERLKDLPVILTNSSGVHPIPIAEHVFTFMLMFARQFHKSHTYQITQKQWTTTGIAGGLSELNEATIGIVGYGRIGQRIARIAQGFDMKVLALSRTSAGKVDSDVDQFISPNEINSLLQQADYVVNCLPLTKETTGFFDDAKLSQMKPSSYFINIGRGGTVVQNDLITSLKNNDIAGAGLDVFDVEPLSADSELWNLDNVILTPHYAGWTPKYIDRVISIFLRQCTWIY